MEEDIYSTPGVINKAHLDEDSNKEERVVSIYVSAESLTVYENPWVDGIPQNTPGPSVPEHPVTEVLVVSKRNLLRVSAVFVGLLCLLLAVITCLGIQLNRDKAKWIKEQNQLQNKNTSLQQKTDQLIANNSQLRRERNEKKLDEIRCCSWKKIHSSCDCFFEQTQQWQQSKEACENNNAHFEVISSKEEEDFITTNVLQSKSKAWIGLKIHDNGVDWEWVDGTHLTQEQYVPVCQTSFERIK
ncbi:natural killer cells antigen CD94-like [Thalassophryne amazonica]|uniref:natural killer cells antigen CD94-like n=1 Tax=Thalassophryne amazonica TaxID=390379 RepID=UPI0014717A0E|nr:natural killer cells antigen CD94-like [Thalassophryne amazonica]